LTQPE